ncbi:MAG: hypothetical protein JWR32_505 [Mycobacterium sp.]|jgi:hypothetical protein|nr:hypothetical protein [Mycobacterium sp.]
MARHDRPAGILAQALHAHHVAVADPAAPRPKPDLAGPRRDQLPIHQFEFTLARHLDELRHLV